MNTFILLFFLWRPDFPNIIAQAEFYSLESCQITADYAKNNFGGYYSFYICSPK